MKYKNYYEYDVYEDGKIFSHISNRFLQLKPNSQGYLATTLYPNGQLTRVRIHRLVAMLFIGMPPDEEHNSVNHKDGNKQNNHYSNLEWCTTYENNKHARGMGLNNISEANRRRYSDLEFCRKQGLVTSKTVRERGSNSGEQNGRFRYRIFLKDRSVISRKELKNLLGVSQAFVDKAIHDYCLGIKHPIFVKSGITVIDIKSSSESQSTIENTSEDGSE